MREFGTFAATATEVVPARYLIPADVDVALDRLEAHGLRIGTADAALEETIEAFRVDSSSVAEREFQGHRERTVHGAWEARQATLPAGTRIVETSQPLGRLAFYLLEPRADDGLAAWALLDEWLERGEYPILRVR